MLDTKLEAIKSLDAEKAERIAIAIAIAIRSEMGDEGALLVQAAIVGLTKGLAIADSKL